MFNWNDFLEPLIFLGLNVLTGMQFAGRLPYTVFRKLACLDFGDFPVSVEVVVGDSVE